MTGFGDPPAYEAGYEAAARGVTAGMVPDYASPEERRQWRAGWSDGQADHARARREGWRPRPILR